MKSAMASLTHRAHFLCPFCFPCRRVTACQQAMSSFPYLTFFPRLCVCFISFHDFAYWLWRGAPLLPTRPKGTSHASLSSGCHHAKAIAQSSPGDVGSPAFAADDSSEDALAVHNARIRKDTRSCTTMCAGAVRPPAHPTAHSHAQGTRVASTAGTRRRPRAVA